MLHPLAGIRLGEILSPAFVCSGPRLVGDVAQLVRVPDCRSGGCGFESRRPRQSWPFSFFLIFLLSPILTLHLEFVSRIPCRSGYFRLACRFIDKDAGKRKSCRPLLASGGPGSVF